MDDHDIDLLDIEGWWHGEPYAAAEEWRLWDEGNVREYIRAVFDFYPEAREARIMSIAVHLGHSCSHRRCGVELEDPLE